MTLKQFQDKYHNYVAHSQTDALSDMLKVNAIAEGFKCVAVELPNLGWILMVDTAAELISELGLI